MVTTKTTAKRTKTRRTPRLSSRQPKKRLRSGFEERIRDHLESLGVGYEYEPESSKVEYIQKHTYTPDFVLDNGIIIEAKGYMDPKDRKKHILIKKQYPDLDIRFVFQAPFNRLNKRSKTTYAEWAEKNGFQWASTRIPTKWINEK